MEKSLVHLPERKQDEVGVIGSKITKEQLGQLGLCVGTLQEVTERICKEKIESFV